MALTLSTRLPRSCCCMRILPQRVPLADLQHKYTKPNKIAFRLQSHCMHNQVPLNECIAQVKASLPWGNGAESPPCGTGTARSRVQNQDERKQRVRDLDET